MRMKRSIAKFSDVTGYLRNILDSKRHNAMCVTSPSPGNQVDGLPGGVSTGAVVASWDPDRRATIHIFEMKNECFEENYK